MTGLLSFPPELLHEITQLCPQKERCRLRATCRVLNEVAEPIIFRRLSLHLERASPHITEHQIIALATRSSKACEFTKDMDISSMYFKPRASEHSLPHFGHCDDLRVHLPTAISTLRNLICFRWEIYDHDPDWMVNSLMQAAARLPRLTELHVNWNECGVRIPFGLFSNLSKLSVSCEVDMHPSFFISQMATVIANSPRLRFLNVDYSADTVSPTLSDLFAKVSTRNPLCLEHLSVVEIDATITRATLPHLKHLTSFEFRIEDEDLAARVWTSFLDNNIKLSDVVVQDIEIEEMMLYLSSFSGLKRLVMDDVGDLESMLFADVLPKHVNSLQTLHLSGCVFDHTNSKSIINCLKLRDLKVHIGYATTVQLLLDTVARLPELKILRICIDPPLGWGPGPTDFKPKPGLQYVEELETVYSKDRWGKIRRYVLADDMGQPLGYREIQWYDDSD